MEKQDLEVLTAFYNVFLEGSYIQVFDDAKGKYGIQPMTMRFSEIRERFQELKKLNKDGASISFCPNPSDGGRKRENVISIKWVCVDTDNTEKAEVVQLIKICVVKPNIVVETKRGFHLYWQCKFASEEEFLDAFNRLNFYFEGDQQMGDYSHCSRIPGFNHVKDKENPYQIKIRHFNMEKDYVPKDFKALKMPQEHFRDMHGNELDAVKDVPVKDVLNRLGVQVNRTNQIVENGEPTSAFVNVKGNYVNRFSGKPGSGSNIDVAMYYGKKSKADAIIWLKESFGISTNPKQMAREPVEIIRSKIDKQKTILTWGTRELDRVITPIEDNHLILFSGESGSGKTAFALDMAIKNSLLGLNVLYISLEMTKAQIYKRIARSYAGINKQQWRDADFTEKQKRAYEKKMDEIKSYSNLNLTTCSADIEGIIKYITSEKPAIAFVDNFDLISVMGKMAEIEKQDLKIASFQDLTNTKKIPVFLIHHYAKPKTQKEQRSVHSIRGSAKINHGADTTVICSRSPNENPSAQDLAEFNLIQVKDREFGDSPLVAFAKTYFNSGTFDDEWMGKTNIEQHLEKIGDTGLLGEVIDIEFGQH